MLIALVVGQISQDFFKLHSVRKLIQVEMLYPGSVVPLAMFCLWDLEKPRYVCFQTVWVKMTERAKRGWNERDHKTFRQTINWACRNRFFFAWWIRVPGACFGPKWPNLAQLEHPKKVPSFKKEAERGWKSWARSLSWKSGWKPSTNFGTNAFKKSCFVSEIRPFEEKVLL